MDEHFHSKRDLRLDFIRGVALYMILVDHVIGDPVSHFTYRVLGLSDAAEIFVFVSGLTCGIVYFRLLDRSGWQGLFGAVAGRAMRMLVYCVLINLTTALLVQVGLAVLGVSHSPPASTILLLYLLLTVIVMPLFFWGAQRNAFATLCVSGTLWLIAQLFPRFGHAVTDLIWFNPLAWQFLFVLGLFFGMRYAAPAQQRALKSFKWLLALAWVVVVGSFLYRFSLFAGRHAGFDIEWLRLSTDTVLYMKETLSPVRILHFLSVAFLFATYIRRDNPFLKFFAAKPFILAGQRSLEMFSISVVLSVAANIYVQAESPSLIGHLMLDGVLAAAMALTAILITRPARVRAALVEIRSRVRIDR